MPDTNNETGLRRRIDELQQQVVRLEDTLRKQQQEIEEWRAAKKWLASQEAELRATLYGIGDGVIATDLDGRVVRMNPVAEQMTGWSEAEAAGRPLDEIFYIVDEATGRRTESPVARVLRAGTVVGLANHTLLVAKDGREIPIADSGAPILDTQDEVTGVVLVFREQTEERLNRRLLETRLALIEYAVDHTLAELLTYALDEVGGFVDSPIGFYHFVEADQQTLALQQWSTRTLQEFCQAEGEGLHYDIDQAGVWVACVYQKKPVIHNDYASLPHKKGLPEGHARVVRELVVPVMRSGQVVAILGVGNKPADYTEKDVEIVAYLADVTWEVVCNKRAEVSLRESEERYRRLVENMDDLIYRYEFLPKRGFSYVSPSATEITGFSPEDHYADPDLGLKLVHPEDRHLLEQIGYREEAVRKPIALRWIKKDGAVIWTEQKNVPIYDEAGNLVALEGVARPITERKESEEKLRQERDKAQTYLDIAGVMFVAMNARGEVTLINRKGSEILGYEQVEILGRNWFESFIPARLRDRVRDAFDSLMAGQIEPVESYENSVVTKGGDERLIAWHNTILKDSAGHIVGTLSSGEDITERKRAEAERIRLNADLTAKNAELEQVVYVASHDLRSPLVNIDGYSKELGYALEDLGEALAGAPAEIRAAVVPLLEQDIPEALRFIRASASKMDTLLTGLLRLSRSGRAALAIEPVDMNKLMANVINAIEFQIQAAGIELEVGDLPSCQSDAVQVNQIFSNLVNNALKYLDPDRPGVIRITGQAEAERAVYCVEDNGIGIAPAHLDKIFEIFHRLDPAHSEGEGLGLTIIKRIVSRLDGDVWVESEPGLGSRFYVALPAKQRQRETE